MTMIHIWFDPWLEGDSLINKLEWHYLNYSRDSNKEVSSLISNGASIFLVFPATYVIKFREYTFTVKRQMISGGGNLNIMAGLVSKTTWNNIRTQESNQEKHHII